MPVHAAVTGLAANTKYDFRLIAVSAEFGRVPGLQGTVETAGPPRLGATVFSGVGQTSATVSGSIDPDAESTSYVVEYVTAAAFAESGYATATKVPVAGAGIGSGREPVPVSQELIGLVPGTTYHFGSRRRTMRDLRRVPMRSSRRRPRRRCSGRVWPTNRSGSARVLVLPDCRAYEQASSPDKGGGTVAGLYSLELASEDGSKATFYSPASHVASGRWRCGELRDVPDGPQRHGGFLGLTAAPVAGEVRRVRPNSSAPPLICVTRSSKLEARANKACSSSTPKTARSRRSRRTRSCERGDNDFGFDGAGGDGERIFFESLAVLPTNPAVPAPVAGHDNLYVWDRASGDVSLVGVLPAGEGGAAPPAGSFGGAYEWYRDRGRGLGGALSKTEGGGDAPMAVAAVHAISPSGSQIFFTAAGTGQLYLRRGLDGGSPNTLRISAPNTGVSDPNGAKPAAFQEATPDGSRAFFMSAGKLTATSTTGAGDSGMDLYRWDAASESLVDIAPDRRDANGAEVQGLLGVNSSGNTGYFIARGVLARGSESGPGKPIPLLRRSQRRVHHHPRRDPGRRPRGRCSEPDRRNVSPEVTFNYELGKTSRVSEDGETLLFESAVR